MRKQKQDMDFLKGNLFKEMFIFSLPLIATNFLQLLFNLSDLAVVGQFDGPDALGAVGSTTMLVAFFSALIVGNANGINSLIARHLGANDPELTRKRETASFYYMIAYGIFLLVIGVALAKEILVLMQTNAEFLPDSTSYLRIYFLGCPALTIYNFGNAVLSAKGETNKPLFVLFISGIINIVLNLVFVICFRMGVKGVALASVISQYLSAIAILFLLFKDKSIIRLNPDPRITNRSDYKIIVPFCLISGFQNATFAFANMIVQIGVNSFDKTMISGNSASINADSVVYDVMSAFYVAGCSFISQNYGAGNKKRIKDAYLISLGYAFSIGILLGVILFFFGRRFLSIFTSDEAVIDCGMERMKIMTLSYGFSAVMDAPIAANRGLGKTTWPTIFVLIGVVIFRITWIYTIFAYFKTVPSLYILYIFSFLITGILENIYLFIVMRKLKMVTQGQ